MNVVDSSGWIEFFQAGPNGPAFRTIIVDTAALIVPAISIYEVFKWVAREQGEKPATQFAAAMQQGWGSKSAPISPLRRRGSPVT